MSQTPLTASQPYVTAAVLFQMHDWQQCADLLRVGDNPRPSYCRMLDATSIEGAKLLQIGLSAAGEIEGACLVGNRYLPTDLQALTGAGLGVLQKLNADLWFYFLMESRQPGSADPERVPGFKRALEKLDLLEKGERLFSFAESGSAGLPTVARPNHQLQAHPIVQDARPVFGTHAGRGRRYGY